MAWHSPNEPHVSGNWKGGVSLSYSSAWCGVVWCVLSFSSSEIIWHVRDLSAWFAFVVCCDSIGLVVSFGGVFRSGLGAAENSLR